MRRCVARPCRPLSELGLEQSFSVDAQYLLFGVFVRLADVDYHRITFHGQPVDSSEHCGCMDIDLVA